VCEYFAGVCGFEKETLVHFGVVVLSAKLFLHHEIDERACVDAFEPHTDALFALVVDLMSLQYFDGHLRALLPGHIHLECRFCEVFL